MRSVPRGDAGKSRIFASPGLALMLIALLLLIAMPTGAARDSVTLGIQLSCCVLGGVAVLRPLLAGVVLGVLITLLLVVHTSFLGLAVLALPVPIAVAATRGHRIWALVFAGWYLGVSIALTAEYADSAIDMARGVDFWLVFMFAPLLLGEVIRRLQQRSERQRKEQALAAERQRRAIARDLHDTLAYATTTMVMRAEQARLRGGHDEQTLGDFDFIAATGRSASADLRTMLALLRDPDRELNGDDADPLGVLPPSRLEEVVVAQWAKLRAFDFDVNLAVNGDPRELPERLSTVVARVFTEAASNITKHGDPSQEVTAMIDVDAREVEAVFVNAARAAEPATGHRGMGLMGLREVVAAEGGTLTSGPVGGRWITHLTIPTGDQPRGGESGG